ncbi:hypothetical protein [Fusobacterium sp.]|uniref:hypothetical protein n=1 Tax=Fusobacterium sp. TaxID=68766 RepID=UPI0026250F5D|nr:hypothetical protein [Fusobacterium sp.]
MLNILISKKIAQMKNLQKIFYSKFGVDDIWSNSKIYEIIVANSLNHELIPGHSGSKDAFFYVNKKRIECEYKHYKESSSNHTWTFNDFSDATISSLRNNVNVYFAHIDDSEEIPLFDWYYEVPGEKVADFLEEKTPIITNARKMINISKNDIENKMNIYKSYVNNSQGKYQKYLFEIFSIITYLENITNTKNLLTSNKFWELLVALKLNHKINSEQGGREGAHDAYDEHGNTYEYKVSKTYSWNFQDISENVLNKYYSDEEIILAVVDKKNMEVLSIYSANPKNVVPRLKEKLDERLQRNGGALRRLQVALSKTDLTRIGAVQVYKR